MTYSILVVIYIALECKVYLYRVYNYYCVVLIYIITAVNRGKRVNNINTSLIHVISLTEGADSVVDQTGQHCYYIYLKLSY